MVHYSNLFVYSFLKMAGGEASKRVSKWYFGGLASAGAACCTHPLDLLKVHLQTAGKEKTNLLRSTANIVKNQGILALYNGLSASLLRQLTYSTTRFAIYDVSYAVGNDLSKVSFQLSPRIWEKYRKGTKIYL